MTHEKNRLVSDADNTTTELDMARERLRRVAEFARTLPAHQRDSLRLILGPEYDQGPPSYTYTHPMPVPLLAAMDSLLRHGVSIPADGTYPAADGHHFTAVSGSLTVHVVLALDHYADTVGWADDDLTWTATLDGKPLILDRWPDVCGAVRQHAPRTST